MFFFLFEFDDIDNSSPTRKANKGEWSEVYTMFKLLGEGKLYAGDEKYNKINNSFYPILNIIREEIIKKKQVEIYDYEVVHKNNDYSEKSEGVIIHANNEEIMRMDANSFLEAADHLLGLIKNGKGRSFATSEKNEAFMEKVHCKNVKRSAGHKSDIDLHLYDIVTQIDRVLGMSIKSLIGGKPTLLNTSDATLITFSVEGADFTDEEINRINCINSGAKLKQRISAIHEKGAKLVFKEYESDVFKDNLDLIDSALPTILASAIYTYYSVNKKRTCEDIISETAKINPLNSSNKDLPKYYRMKFTKLLEASALGMYPATPYDDSTDAKGYIIVKDDGDVVCYHFYDRDMDRKHLFENTSFDTPSSSKENRKEFCNLYRTENNELEIQLNFQIRWN